MKRDLGGTTNANAPGRKVSVRLATIPLDDEKSMIVETLHAASTRAAACPSRIANSLAESMVGATLRGTRISTEIIRVEWEAAGLVLGD
jgi:hypothetical protein